MRKIRYAPFILSIIILVASIAIVRDNNDIKPTATTATVDELSSDIKGVWVSYITLDMQNTDCTEDVFTEKIQSIINKTKENGFNTIIFQVRPFSDALYESQFYPWSHILTGEQGTAPKFDPLEIMCDLCHKNEVNIHAWINPYRVKTSETPEKLSEYNPYYIDNSIGFEHDDNIYLDPSNEKAQKLIINGVKEIVENYDIDGIQFDDYFYPEGADDFDNETYELYKENQNKPLSKDEWRKENVNNLIEGVYKAIHNTKDEVIFGISPQGNLRNNEALFADVKTWCKEKGYIDYICPQIYFSLDNPALSFEDSLDEWLNLEMHKDLKLYIGLAGYKGGSDEDEGTWLDNDDILKTQIQICEKKNLNGFMLYSYESFLSEENAPEIANVANYLTGITE